MSLILLFLMVCLMQGFPHVQALHISGKFWDGDIQFNWEKTSQSYEEFYITRDERIDIHDWQKSYNNSYLFRGVLRYTSVTITVYEALKGERHNFTYKVSKVESVIDKTTALSMPLDNLNLSCSSMYQVRWNNNKILEKQLLMIRENKLQEYDASKYQQVKLSNSSKTMTFKIKNVTPEDSGFYAWGINASDALSRPGVVLVVHKKPLTPNVSGKMREVVGNTSHLTCSSELISFPAYYSKLFTLSYSWFLNDTKLSGATRETLSVKVTKRTKYDRYSCTARDMLDSDRSIVVKIDPLYGPDKVSFDPQPIQLKKNIVVTLREGDKFGPYKCLADCNPPCTFTWKYKNITTTDFVGVASIGGQLLSQTVKRDIKVFRCIAEGLYGKPVKGSIYLHVLYMESPQFYLNSTHRTISADVQEDNVLRLSCFVEGNPTPRLQLSKRHHKREVVLSDSTTHWSNYSFEREVTCSDSGVYVCTSRIEGFGSKRTQIYLNILCDPRYEHGDQFELYSGDTIGLDRAIIVKIPVTSNPPPVTSKMTWIGPDDQIIDAKSVVSQQNDDEIFNHLIISIVQITDARIYGEYRVLYNSHSLINFTVNTNDLHTIVFQGFNNETCRVSEIALLTAAIISTFLAVILISVILLFCCSKKRDTKERTNNEVYLDTAARQKVWESEPNYNNTTDDIYFYSTLNDEIQEEEL